MFFKCPSTRASQHCQLLHPVYFENTGDPSTSPYTFSGIFIQLHVYSLVIKVHFLFKLRFLEYFLRYTFQMMTQPYACFTFPVALAPTVYL